MEIWAFPPRNQWQKLVATPPLDNSASVAHPSPSPKLDEIIKAYVMAYETFYEACAKVNRTAVRVDTLRGVTTSVALRPLESVAICVNTQAFDIAGLLSLMIAARNCRCRSIKLICVGHLHMPIINRCAKMANVMDVSCVDSVGEIDINLYSRVFTIGFDLPGAVNVPRCHRMAIVADGVADVDTLAQTMIARLASVSTAHVMVIVTSNYLANEIVGAASKSPWFDESLLSRASVVILGPEYSPAELLNFLRVPSVITMVEDAQSVTSALCYDADVYLGSTTLPGIWDFTVPISLENFMARVTMHEATPQGAIHLGEIIAPIADTLSPAMAQQLTDTIRAASLLD